MSPKETSPFSPACRCKGAWAAIISVLGAFLAASAASGAPHASPLLCAPGTIQAVDLSRATSTETFDVLNRGEDYLLLVFEPTPDATLSPSTLRLGPGSRESVTLSVRPGVKTLRLAYDSAYAATPFSVHSNRYRAYADGESEMCVPVAPELYAAMRGRAQSIFSQSKTPITDPAMPPGTLLYTPGPYYRRAGIFARDILYQLEGGGRGLSGAQDIGPVVAFLALKQLREDRRIGTLTFPAGAIPDHVRPDGVYGWGPGEKPVGDSVATYNRPSMDEAMCFVILAWHYGYTSGWDQAWEAWFGAHAAQLSDAWNSVPRNPATGLVTQWTTVGHVGAHGIAEATGPCVMWGFHDNYGFPGDDLGTSILACNAARALADMCEHAGDPAQTARWQDAAAAMGSAIRAQFNNAGYLPWGVGDGAPTMASPDLTGYAVWSAILSNKQADAASDWFAERYRADRASGGAADLFNMTVGLRGSVRMARKVDDLTPGSMVWPRVTPPHWARPSYPYNDYQDGGYWYYMSMGIAKTLWRRHPAEAKEWVANAYSDVIAGGIGSPYERIDGTKPVNSSYNASVGSLLGMGMPAYEATVAVTLRP